MKLYTCFNGALAFNVCFLVSSIGAVRHRGAELVPVLGNVLGCHKCTPAVVEIFNAKSICIFLRSVIFLSLDWYRCLF